MSPRGFASRILLPAILAAGGVRYDEWMRFTFPLYLALVALGGISVAIAVGINLQ